jgi:3-phosphoshikimate 1-carboxyvinyltransferase
MEYTLPVASAQVKSAILLAGLNTAGTTTVIEPHATRDHTERMLTAMGASITSDKHSDGATHISIQGHPTLSPLTLQVPADISSAAFLMVAGLLFENGTITLPHVGINPLRTGLIDTLKEMGADITFSDKTIHAGEPIATITVAASSPLKGIRVPAERAPSMIDEYPILAVAAAHAKGTSVFEGLGELRVKESDRLSAIAQGLKACGVIVHETEDSLTIEGCNGKPPGGATMIQTHHDHRIAMSFLIMGLTAKQSVTIDDASMISTSFPDFIPLMESLGASFVL